MIETARQSRLLSQKELAQKLEITTSQISRIENGLLDMPDKYIQKLAAILNYPESFFIESGDIYPLPWNFYRKNKNISQKRADQITATINIYRKHIEKLLKSVELENKIEYMGVEVDRSPVDIAGYLREYYQIPKGPIENMTNFLEDIGIFIINTDFGMRDFSGVSTRVGNTHHVIFINSNMPGDRQRFTLAHEWGHIAMHNFPSEKMEEEAHTFASEFLMPSKDIAHQFNDLSLEKLALLKLFWKTSMQAILLRAKDLKKITEKKSIMLWKQLSSKGYKLNEPIEFSIPREEPKLIKETINLFIDELGYTEHELSKLLNLNEEEFERLYVPSENKLKLIKA